MKTWNGKPIAMPGIVSDMPIEFYHSKDACVEPSISSSGLRTIFNKSPKHYWCSSVYNPERIEPEETEALILGRAAHHLLFSQSDFRKLFTVRPLTINGEAWHGSKIICKVWTKKAQDEGLTILTPVQLDQIKGMAMSLSEHPLVKAGILNGQIEQSMFVKEPVTGIWLKARPDAMPTDSADMVDLKTCRSVQREDIIRSIRDHAYHMQAGLLSILCQELLKRRMNSFSLVFIEKTPPYCTRVVTLKETDIERGERQCRAALKIFSECWKSKHWPGPGGDQTDAEYTELPEYEQKRIDERLKLELPQ